MRKKRKAKKRRSPVKRPLGKLWEEHLDGEFTTKDTEATLKTMVADAYVNHIPVLTGGVGHEELREFYSKHFIPKMPPDTKIVPVSRTIGPERLFEERIFRFSQSIEIAPILPSIPPTAHRHHY